MRNTGTRGYTGYRGRRPTGRRWLVVLLILIILAAAASLLAQRYLVFEMDGSYYFDLPWLERDSDGKPMIRRSARQDLEIVIERPEQEETAEETVPLHAQELDAAKLRSGVSGALSALPEEVNAVAVRLKTVKGDLLYPSALSDAAEAKAVAANGYSEETLRELTSSGYYTIARLSALHDSRYTVAFKGDVALLQKARSGRLWFAPDSSFYLAPEKEATRQYLANIAVEVAALGFDELLFDEFSYPTTGRLNNIFTDDREMTQEAALALLADNLRETLRDTGVKLSIVMDADTVLAGANEKSGQNLAELAIRFDRIYVQTTEEQLPALRSALENYPAQLVPILRAALPDGADSYLIS